MVNANANIRMKTIEFQTQEKIALIEAETRKQIALGEAEIRKKGFIEAELEKEKLRMKFGQPASSTLIVDVGEDLDLKSEKLVASMSKQKKEELLNILLKDRS
jgi:hypothetical protein